MQKERGCDQKGKLPHPTLCDEQKQFCLGAKFLDVSHKLYACSAYVIYVQKSSTLRHLVIAHANDSGTLFEYVIILYV